ncbi:hypothetical protein MMC17_004612 [Xylographa soralifera]|nr:hypothetical protein [Xylographa soralifera]
MDILQRFMSYIDLAWPRSSSMTGFQISPRPSDEYATSPSFDISSPLMYYKRFNWNRTACLLTYSATIPASGIAPRNAQQKKKYTLSPLIQTILKRAEDMWNLGDLGKLPTELIFLVLDELPIHARAALALTSTSFMRFEGASCWTAMNGFESPNENMSFLSLLEKDMMRKEAKLACSHCLSLHEPNAFDSIQRLVSSSTTRLCYRAYQEVHLTSASPTFMEGHGRNFPR